MTRRDLMELFAEEEERLLAAARLEMAQESQRVLSDDADDADDADDEDDADDADDEDDEDDEEAFRENH